MGSQVTEDQRIDPRIKAMFGEFSPPLIPELESREALLAMLAVIDQGEPTAPDSAPYETVVPTKGLTIRRETITSHPDGNSVHLQIITPGGGGRFPCVYYFHGGGMMMASYFDPNYSA